MTVLGLHFDDGLLELEAGASDHRPVLLGTVVAEEHRRSEPIRLDGVRRILGAHRCDEDAAGSQPTTHRGEELGQVGARDMGQRVEGDDRVEAGRRDVEGRHVRLDERRLRNGGTCELDLPSRDIDAGHMPPGGEGAGHRNAGAAAEVEDVGTGRDALERLGQPAQPCRGGSRVAPRVVAIGDRVVSVGDDLARVHGVVDALRHDQITTS